MSSNFRGHIAAILICYHAAVRSPAREATLTSRQRSIIVGSLLGDGAMRCKANALLEINHCFEQRDYVDWKYRELANLVRTPPKARTGNGARIAYRFTTLSLPALTPIFWDFYGGAKKAVSALELTPLALAVWFMDDGSKTHRAAYLNTQQFDRVSQERMMHYLLVQFGLHSSLNRDKRYFRIRLAVHSMSRFRELVAPHLLPSFLYKLST
jgi:recombination protein RecA